MLEQQQAQLVDALQEMYHRLRRNELWPGTKLTETNGQPLTHDILHILGLSGITPDRSGEAKEGEENFEEMQLKLLANSARFAHRRGSINSNYDRNSRSNESLQNTPRMTMQPSFDNQFDFTPSSSPSPAPCQKESAYPPPKLPLLCRATSLIDHSQPLQPELSGWSFTEAEATIELEYAMWTPRLPQMLDHVNHIANWDEIYETDMEWPSHSVGRCKDSASAVMSQVAQYSSQL